MAKQFVLVRYVLLEIISSLMVAAQSQNPYDPENQMMNLLKDWWKFVALVGLCMALGVVYLMWILGTDGSKDSQYFDMITFWPLSLIMHESGNAASEEGAKVEDAPTASDPAAGQANPNPV